MSSILVDFEVLPEEGATDRTAAQVCSDLQRQLADPGSALNTGEFARFAAHATLSHGSASGSGGGCAGAWDAPLDAGAAPCGSHPGLEEPRGGSSVGGGFGNAPSESRAGGGLAISRQDSYGSQACGAGAGAAGPYGASSHRSSSQQAHADAASRYGSGAGVGAAAAPDWQHAGHHYDGACGMSNADLIDRIQHLERSVAHTAAGGAQEHMTTRRAGEVEALEDRIQQQQHRLEVLERELREAHEASVAFRSRAEQAELRLKDREQLLAHAKEMWMKESVRASKLSEALTEAEDRLADQDRRLLEAGERQERTQQEVRQLQHLIGGSAPLDVGGASSSGFGGAAFGVDGGFRSNGSAKGYGAVPATTGNLAATLDRFHDAGGFDGDLFGSIEEPGAHLRRSPGTDRSLSQAGPDGFINGRGHGSSTAGGYGAALSSIEADTNADRFRRLCLLDDAVLYEDDMLQIGLKSEYSGREGQLAVYFGNKGSAALQAFTVQYFVREDRALRLTASPLSQQVEADQQVVQRLSVVLADAFAEPPVLRVQFLLPDASPRRIQIRFPVLVTKFMVGRELSQSEFFRFWRLQNFVLNEVTNIVHLAARFRGALVQVARCLVFGGALRLLPGVDNNPDNFVLVGRLAEGAPGLSTSAPGERNGAAGHYRGGGGSGMSLDPLSGEASSGMAESGLSLIRVELGSGRYAGKVRVVVRSDSQALSRALCDSIVIQLGEVGAQASGGPGDRDR
eukprot:TRINITY_DN7965_c0_g1_i1.p1 TRINITY_DN7965_c0_g1~~TRINITY_DN7965_c0_g1_i1.p1  ORF type:complete len:739 (+),score=174.46 TRINITY_DN7965_c0_g1_i1:147-2363(+)